ncbi:transmembrane protein, putative [Medicago truncatula]|uniref:Transmembrane protein, putative n=1 Tax=Medicago truncatula TaxID=3880 RepID=G7KX38_MEDTR|nr:transmembrane protein, putative [Medicago truncatula]
MDIDSSIVQKLVTFPSCMQNQTVVALVPEVVAVGEERAHVTKIVSKLATCSYYSKLNYFAPLCLLSCILVIGSQDSQFGCKNKNDA